MLKWGIVCKIYKLILKCEYFGTEYDPHHIKLHFRTTVDILNTMMFLVVSIKQKERKILRCDAANDLLLTNRLLLLTQYNNRHHMQERPLELEPPLTSLTQHRHKWGEFTHNKSWRRQYHAAASDERRLHMHKPVCERRAGDTDDWRMERGEALHIPHVIAHTDEELTAGCRCGRRRVSYGSRLWLRKWTDHLHAQGSLTLPSPAALKHTGMARRRAATLFGFD